MAVSAEQNALPRFFSRPCKGPTLPLVAEVKLLESRIEVMELKCLGTARIGAYGTSAAGLLHQGALDDSSTLGNGLGPALHTAVVPPTFENELCDTMTPAAHFSALWIALGSRPPAANRSELIPSHPMPDGRRAPPCSDGDFTLRKALSNKGLQLSPSKGTPGRILLGANRRKAMLSQPVANVDGCLSVNWPIFPSDIPCARQSSNKARSMQTICLARRTEKRTGVRVDQPVTRSVRAMRSTRAARSRLRVARRS